MFVVLFKDKYLGMSIEHFDNFNDAVEYWNEYADAETCERGLMLDFDNAEIIWKF